MENEEIKDADLISMVRMRGLRPSQIFKGDELKEDPDFSKIIKAEVDYQIWLENKKIEEEIEQYEKKEIKEYEEMERENELIPSDPDYEINDKGKKETEEQEEKKKDSGEDDLIPD